MADPNAGQPSQQPMRQSAPSSQRGVNEQLGPSVGPAATSTGPGEERELWVGRGSPRSFYGQWLLWLVLMVALLIAAMKVKPHLGPNWPLVTIWLVIVVLTGGAVLLRMTGFVLSRKYRVTTQRLFVEVGILSKTINQTDLIRVRDVGVSQSLFGRIFGYGNVRVESPTDVSNPTVTLTAVPTPQVVAEHIHSRMQAFRSAKATVMDGAFIDQNVVDTGGG